MPRVSPAPGPPGPTPATRCGLITIVGRSNVGKSTLLNRILGQKVSITSPKPQTTRQPILGIKTDGACQCVFVDTPGLSAPRRRALYRLSNRSVMRSLADCDAVLFMVEALRWGEDDQRVLERVQRLARPVVLAVTKIDLCRDKRRLLPFLEAAGARMDFAAVVPLSGRTGDNLEAMQAALSELLPFAPFLFPEHQVTACSERFLAAEIIREKLLRRLGAEVPHRIAVSIDQFAERADLVGIHATIWVERAGQRRIVIGGSGAVLKAAGSEARADLEAMLGKQVHLETWVKVKDKWSDDPSALRKLGLAG
ncbi:MAG: GTPase Era [Gammaproteobacteria bacterium]